MSESNAVQPCVDTRIAVNLSLSHSGGSNMVVNVFLVLHLCVCLCFVMCLKNYDYEKLPL